MIASPAAQTVRLADRTLVVRHRRSSGAPAVFIHGLGGSSLNWTDLVEALGDRLDSYCVDLSGFGASPPPRDGDYSPEGQARGVASFIESLGVGPVHVFGNSLGGAVSVQLAARRPDLVRTLTLISPALPRLLPTRDTATLPLIAIPGIGERLVERYMRVDAQRRVMATYDLCCHDGARVPPERVAEAIDDLRARDSLPYSGDAYLQSLRGLLATYLDRGTDRPWRLAERITAPTLLIYGRSDRLVDSIAAHRVHRHFRDSHVVVIPDSGHVAQIEHPEKVAAAWGRFLG